VEKGMAMKENNKGKENRSWGKRKKKVEATQGRRGRRDGHDWKTD